MDQDFGVNQALVEELYLRYCENPHSVDESWLKYFDAFYAEQLRTVGGTLAAPPVAPPVADAGASVAIPPSPRVPSAEPNNGNGNGHAGHTLVGLLPASA